MTFKEFLLQESMDKSIVRKAKDAFRASQRAFGRGDNETGHRLLDKHNKLMKKASRKVKAEKEIADHEHEKTHKSYRASNAIKSVGMGHGVN